jgi:GntR family transcriptional regulator
MTIAGGPRGPQAAGSTFRNGVFTIHSYHPNDYAMPGIPLYKEVRDQIVESLVKSEWRPGDPLPSEKELSSRYSVAISTVRAAIGELVAADILVRKQGKGTFVAHHSARGSHYRFFNVVQNNGEKEPFDRKLLWIRKDKADADAIRTFRLASARRGGDVFRIRIKLSTHGPAFAVAEVVLPVHLFPTLESDSIPDGPESLYALYQERYGVNIIRVDEGIYAVAAPASVAKPLSLATGAPILEVRRVSYTFNDVAVEQRTTWIHTRDHHYQLALGAQG